MWRESLASGDVPSSILDGGGGAEGRESLATGAKDIRHGYALAVLAALYLLGLVLCARGF